MIEILISIYIIISVIYMTGKILEKFFSNEQEKADNIADRYIDWLWSLKELRLQDTTKLKAQLSNHILMKEMNSGNN